MYLWAIISGPGTSFCQLSSQATTDCMLGARQCHSRPWLRRRPLWGALSIRCQRPHCVTVTAAQESTLAMLHSHTDISTSAATPAFHPNRPDPDHLSSASPPPAMLASTTPSPHLSHSLTRASVSTFHIASQHRIFTDRISYPFQAIALLALSTSPCPPHL
jgi:hypothetical protein